MADSWRFERPPSSPYKAYLEESHTPLTGLIFSLPLFLLYHVGVWWISEFKHIPWANGADVFIAWALHLMGIGGPLISLTVVVATLLFAQQLQGRRWRLPRPGTLTLMSCECLIFALPPFLLGKLVHQVLLSAGSEGELPFLVNIILSLGAGVYEEFLFRFLLMGALFALFRWLWDLRDTRLYVTVVLTQAVLFALFHHLPGGGETLDWAYVTSGHFLRAFAFRTLAGVYFAYLYQERGFGIAVGSHAFYDVIAVTLNAFR